MLKLYIYETYDCFGCDECEHNVLHYAIFLIARTREEAIRLLKEAGIKIDPTSNILEYDPSKHEDWAEGILFNPYKTTI